MLEKDIENLISQNPDEFFGKGKFTLIGNQVTVGRKRIDILFQDNHGRKVIVEVKRGILSREASGQIAEYYGLLKSENSKDLIELILCANVIPPERKKFLENIGIECLELGIHRIVDLANKTGYIFLDDSHRSDRKFDPEIIKPNICDDVDESLTSVWIFQGNPKRYDVLNALSDPEIGNTIHWLVNQNRSKIKKGHLAIIWMSGQESGIYAIGRIECNPKLMSDPLNERKYWSDDSDSVDAFRVRISIIKRLLNNPIRKDTLLKIADLSGLSILRYCQGTNFPVRNKEWSVISSII